VGWVGACDSNRRGGRILFGLGVAPGRFGDAVLTVWRLGVRGC
jgi:hypothetical protein